TDNLAREEVNIFVRSPTTSVPSPPSATVPPASDDPNYPAYPPGTSGPAEPIRGSLGAAILGPQNIPVQQQNPDIVAPPSTDSGDVPNAKWPFALSSSHFYTGGWARIQNVDVMPIATKMAGVNMRLEAGAIRELHWHQTAEWAYVIRGSTQITSVDQNGRNYVAVVNAGDLWYFPPGIPHSLQATADDPDGSEFLLVFPDGNFNSASSFQVTDWLSHVPKEVIAKNFRQSISAFDNIPSRQLYIFPSEPPTSDAAPSDPQGQVPDPFSFALSKVNVTKLSGGSVKIVDSTTSRFRRGSQWQMLLSSRGPPRAARGCRRSFWLWKAMAA
ncbi:RmlC-like cupin domain-containing protein, partial [Russula vinacea]